MAKQRVTAAIKIADEIASSRQDIAIERMTVDIINDTIERCAQVVDNYPDADGFSYRKGIAAAIRSMKND